MTREEQLKFCKICKKQKFDIHQGIICGLTGLPADFENSCQFFIEDPELRAQQELRLESYEILQKTAGKGKRFANFLLDWVFYLIFSFIFGLLLGIVLVLVSPESASNFEADNFLLDFSVGLVAAMIYFTTLETLTGRTIAKFITKTRVVRENGEKPGFGTIFIRSLCRFIPFEPLSFLFSDSSGWHDRFSKTIVIED